MKWPFNLSSVLTYIQLSSTAKSHPRNLRPLSGIPVTVYTERRHGKRSRKIARLTIVQSEDDLNLASPNLATKLGATIHEDTQLLHFQGGKLYTQGYILVDWAPESCTEPYYQTRFEVVENEDFPYDITLGNGSAVGYGFPNTTS